MKTPLTFLVASVRAEVVDAQAAIRRAHWHHRANCRPRCARSEHESARINLERIALLLEQIEKQHAEAVA